MRLGTKEERVALTEWPSDSSCLSEATIDASHITLRLSMDTMTRKPSDVIQIRRMR